MPDNGGWVLGGLGEGTVSFLTQRLWDDVTIAIIFNMDGENFDPVRDQLDALMDTIPESVGVSDSGRPGPHRPTHQSSKSRSSDERFALCFLSTMHCAFCRAELAYVHGHAACVRSGCPMFGVNQAECCSGETAQNGPLTAEVTGAGRPPAGVKKQS